jgi:site-specific DNA-methyltransferase (cytosine-N4-specific)
MFILSDQVWWYYFTINLGIIIPLSLAGGHFCNDQEKGIKPHPARFPADLPEYFIRMLTDPGDFVFDPFAGSCVTGEVAERLARKWVCAELVRDYLDGALGRFERPSMVERPSPEDDDAYYRVPRPGLFWNGSDPVLLAANGGQTRPASMKRRAKSRHSTTDPADSSRALAAKAAAE